MPTGRHSIEVIAALYGNRSEGEAAQKQQHLALELAEVLGADAVRFERKA